MTCIVLSHRLVCASALSISREGIIRCIEVSMFLTAKLNLMSGMVIGAAAVMAMKQVCKRKQRNKHHEAHAPVAASD